MFCPLKIKIDEINKLVHDYPVSGEYRELYEQCKSEIENSISVNAVKNSFINGTRLQNECFPNNLKFDVFLSHSHGDVDIVKHFASWLYDNLGLKCFVDSLFWQYSDDLQLGLDEIFSKTGNHLYSYTSSHVISSNVHAMLNMALMTMMDRTECLIFIGSENSLKYSTERKSFTASPWIYEEINFAQKLRINIPDRLKKNIKLNENKKTRTFSAIIPNFRYDVQIDNMKSLTAEDLRNVSRCRENVNPLDLIYKIRRI